MGEKTLYEKYLDDEKFRRYMAQEDLIMDVTENFCKILETEEVSRSRLAKVMGKTKGYISQLLNGGKNLTLRSIADVAFSLGYTVTLSLEKKVSMYNKQKVDSFVIDWNIADKKRLPPANIFVADDYNSCNHISQLAS